MTALELIDRENSGGRTEWIVQRPPLFISHHDNGDELWISNQPHAANERLYRFPYGCVPTLEEVDELLSGMPEDLLPVGNLRLLWRNERSTP